jgi:VWFA-related protein
MTLRHASTVAGLLACCLFWAAPDAAQQKPQQPPAFRSEAELVTVDVVVADKRGDPVADLRAEDFVVTEEGRPQQVQFFQLVTAARQAPSSKAAERTYRYSTNVGAQAHSGRSFVLFLDDVHLSQEQGERAKKALEQFLNEQADAGDLVSVVAPAKGLRWHARLPGGRSELVKVLGSLRGTYLPEVSGERISDYEAYRIHVMQDEQMAERIGRRFSNFRVAGRDPVDLQKEQGPRPENKGGTAGLLEPFVQSRAAEAYVRATARNRTTLGALMETIQSMEAVRGRKSVIVLSPGFILDQELTLFRQVEDAARRANIAMYFVDVRGLDVQSVFASAQFGSPIDSRDIGAANADSTLEAEGAVSLADSSGGFSVQNRNDLEAGLRRIARESQVYYLLGYAPSEARADGKFRRISVRVNRPDVQIRARKGYYAGGVRADPGKHRDFTETDSLEVALDSPYDLDALPVRAAAYMFGDTKAGETSVRLAMEADLRSFELKSADGVASDVLDLRVLVTNPATGEAKRFERAVEMALQGGAPKIETAAWYAVSEALDLAPGNYQARVVVRDRNSGRIGAVTHDFEVPARKGMTLSSLIVTDTIEKPPDGSGPPKAVLTVRRLLNAGTTLYYQFAVFDPGRTAGGETRVRAGHVVRRTDGTVVRELKPTPLVPGQAGMSRFAGISLAGLPSGEYELVVTVIDDVRGETVTVDEPFAIAEPQRVKLF